MKLWIRSDLHCRALEEIGPLHSDPPQHDVAILAGDVSYGLRRTIDALDAVVDRPTVFVAGNHEHYHRTMTHELDQGRDATAHAQHVRFLENAAWTNGGVRFLGATLWCDYDLYGADARELAMRYSAIQSADFGLIMAREKNPLDLTYKSHLFRPADARRLHQESVAWLENQFAAPFDGPTVVVTHHAPSQGSIAKRWRGHPLTPCYVSDISAKIERWRPTLWIHGHVHESFDYLIGDTRIICNPRGLFHGIDAEDSGYDENLVVEI